jgi:hypothetical protein
MSFHLNAKINLRLKKADNFQLSIKDGDSLISFDIYVRSNDRDLSYPRVSVYDTTTAACIYKQDMNYYMHKGSKHPYHIVLPFNFKFSEDHAILFLASIGGPTFNLRAPINKRLVENKFEKFKKQL